MLFKFVGVVVKAAFVVGACSAAVAAEWPTKPVEILVPFPAGGGTDAFARPLSAALTRITGKQFIIDNKGGGGGTVGAAAAAQHAPDGHHFFMGAVHHAIAPAMYPKLAYDLERDFVPVALVASVPQVIVVNPTRLPVDGLQAMQKYIAARPGKVNYGSAGNGTSHQMACELYKMQTNTYIVHIPYRGAGPALQDLIAGQVEMMCDGLGSSAVHIKSGRIKALAVASDKRSSAFPDIPAAPEVGMPNFRVSTWYGLWAPKNTPPEAIESLKAALKQALESPDLKKLWNGMGAETPTLYGKDFGAFVKDETKRWDGVVKRSGAKLD
jgi:tripartite-type tricarboxylate transporter receptor subunit TctC